MDLNQVLVNMIMSPDIELNELARLKIGKERIFTARCLAPASNPTHVYTIHYPISMDSEKVISFLRTELRMLQTYKDLDYINRLWT